MAAAERQALPPAAGKVFRPGVLAAFQPGQGQSLAQARFQGGIGEAVGCAVEAQILQDGQVVIQAEALGHIPDARADLRGVGVHGHAQHLYRAGGGLHQAQQHADGGGLARAIRPEEAEDLSAADFEIDAIHSGEVAEAFGQGARDDCR